jgi:hypothetical protein
VRRSAPALRYHGRTMKPLAALVNTVDPAMPMVRSWLAEAGHPVELLPCERAAGERALVALQVTTRSPLGALVHESGGVLVDGGWLRVLGAGHARLPRGLDTWNGAPAGPPRLEGALLVADDAVGGFFAIDGGAFGGEPGNIYYLAPDTLGWEDCGVGYSDWLYWAFTGDLDAFYRNTRWPGWQADLRDLAGDRAFSIYPFPFTKGPPVAERSRRAVPLEELWGLYAIELPRQLGGGS